MMAKIEGFNVCASIEGGERCGMQSGNVSWHCISYIMLSALQFVRYQKFLMHVLQSSDLFSGLSH